MFLKRIAVVAMVGAMLALGTSAGWANMLAPGGQVSADSFGAISGTSPAPALTDNWVIPFTNPLSLENGTVTSAVISDPNNVFGAGDLDFIYQITAKAVPMASQYNIETFSNDTFTGFETDVGIATSAPGFVAGTATPVTMGVSRSIPGDTINWSFSPTNFQVSTSAVTSVILVVQTNATNYSLGYIGVIDSGSGGAAPTYEPAPATTTSSVPEPSRVVGLLGLLSIAGIGLVWRRAR